MTTQATLKFELCVTEHGFKDFDIVGHPILRRACVPDGIRHGQQFNVYYSASSKAGVKWLGCLNRSLHEWLAVMSDEEKAGAVIDRLSALQPEVTWTTHPLFDYAQYAEVGAPELLVSFTLIDVEETGLVDPYSTLFGKACEPAHWGISPEAAQIVHNFNQVFVAKYIKSDGPRQYV